MLDQYKRINQATGVSITIHQDGSIDISACEVALTGERLDFVNKLTDLKGLHELHVKSGKKSYAALNISGKGVIQKQVDKIEDITPQNFSRILPNAKLADFYVQNFISGNYSFVAIIRKSEADKWIKQLNSKGFQPLTLSLGVYPVQQIVNQTNFYDKDFIFDGHSIGRNEQLAWTSYSYEESYAEGFPVKIDLELINEKLIIPYAAAFQLLLIPQPDLIIADVSTLKETLDKLIDNKKFQLFGFIILSVFFFLLLFNFCLFSWLGSVNTELSGQLIRTSQNNIDIQATKDQIKEKEGILKNLGWDEGVNKSGLIDQIAALLPPELTWQEVDINPIDIETSRIQKNLTFYNRRIRITGKCASVIPVNEWIARIKTRSWVKEIDLESYMMSNELNTGIFTINLTY